MLAAISSLFEVEKLALSHSLFYILAFSLSSVNILCSVSSNAGNGPVARGAFPVNLHAWRSDRFCILCMRLAHLAASYAANVFATLYPHARYTVLALKDRSLSIRPKGAPRRPCYKAPGYLAGCGELGEEACPSHGTQHMEPSVLSNNKKILGALS